LHFVINFDELWRTVKGGKRIAIIALMRITIRIGA